MSAATTLNSEIPKFGAGIENGFLRGELNPHRCRRRRIQNLKPAICLCFNKEMRSPSTQVNHRQSLERGWSATGEKGFPGIGA